MLSSEEKKQFTNSNNLIRIITPDTLPESDTFNPNNFLDDKNSFINNSMSVKIITQKNNKDKISQNNTNNNIKESNNNKRIDRKGNKICKNGKKKVTFIDKISNNKFANIIKVESFKEYNKMEEIKSNFVNHNGCCLIQ